MTKINKELIPDCPEPNKDGLIWKNVSDEIELKDGRGNPFDWSQYQIVWKGENVGWLESGYPIISGKNWQLAEVVDPLDGITHVFFFKGAQNTMISGLITTVKYSGNFLLRK